ncbi:MAG: hypothetical protein IJK54_11660 [Clostridia bacterium]|nr:hypothetical protein [Clostridia bacterium]
MTLLISLFAALITTAVWYKRQPDNEMRLGVLCWLFWGASLMWLVDAIFEYAELGAEYFAPALKDMANDLFLGLSVVALAMIIWLVVLLVTDPKGVIKGKLLKKKQS